MKLLKVKWNGKKYRVASRFWFNKDTMIALRDKKGEWTITEGSVMKPKSEVTVIE